MEITVTAGLRRTVDELGEQAARWLDRVPALAEDTADAWELEVQGPLEHGGSAAVVLAVTTSDGVPAILKLSVPSDESRHEAEALLRWDGDGAVTLLRRSDDGFVLLLERCDPGHTLWSAEPDEQLAVIVDLLPRLWSAVVPPDAPFRELATTAARWGRQMATKARAMGVPPEVAERAERWARELGTDQPRHLLHGDMHPGNVLAARREPWLAIDAKPWIGDPAFDLAQALVNWLGEGDPATNSDHAALHLGPEAIGDRAARLAAALDLELGRILRWAVVKAIGWDFGRPATLVLDAAARDA